MIDRARAEEQAALEGRLLEDDLTTPSEPSYPGSSAEVGLAAPQTKEMARLFNEYSAELFALEIDRLVMEEE